MPSVEVAPWRRQQSRSKPLSERYWAGRSRISVAVEPEVDLPGPPVRRERRQA